MVWCGVAMVTLMVISKEDGCAKLGCQWIRRSPVGGERKLHPPYVRTRTHNTTAHLPSRRAVQAEGGDGSRSRGKTDRHCRAVRVCVCARAREDTTLPVCGRQRLLPVSS